MGTRYRSLPALLIAAALAAPGWVGAQRTSGTADGPPVSATTVRSFKSDLRTVPRLEGVPAGRVDTLLEEARLVRGATRYESRSGSAGIVVGQSPAAGTPVKIGSPVDVVISVAPPDAERTPPARDRSTSRPSVDPLGALLGRMLQEAMKPPPTPPQPEPLPATPERVPGARTTPERPAEPPPERPADTRPATPERSVTVPNLIGRTLASQAPLLRERRLGVDAVTERDSAEPVGVVLAQRPAAGTQVRPGSMVSVAVSRGPPPRVTVPDVVGIAESVAHARLADRKLPFEARAVASTRAEGVVLAQSPAAGSEVAPGTTVRLQVSDGSLVAVPALVGESAELAGDALARVGLRGEVETRESQAPPGQVLDQQPNAGSTARRGSTVRYWAAAAAQVTVPDVTGLALDEAVERLGGSLRAEPRSIDSTTVAAGRVATQSPAPGTIVDAGAAVRIEVSLGAPPLADLTGLDLDQARAAAAQTGARLADPQPAFDAAPSGTVIGQSPAPGARLPTGGTVTLRVSRGPLWPWLAGGAAALAVVAAGAAAALWSPVRYRVRLEPVAAGSSSAALPQAEGPALALHVRLERGPPNLVEQATLGGPS